MLCGMDEGLAEANLAEARLALRIAQAPPGAARDAESDLYRLLAPRVRRYGLRHLRDTHAADDLMQNVMALTIEHLRGGQVRQPERVVSFVFGTCRMVVMELRRGAKRREELLGDPGKAKAKTKEPCSANRHRLLHNPWASGASMLRYN